MYKTALSAVATIMMSSAAYGQSPFDAIMKQCVLEAQTKAPSSGIGCDSIDKKKHSCVTVAPAKTTESVLEVIRTEAASCLQKKGGRKVADEKCTKCQRGYWDFYDFGKGKGVLVVKKWFPRFVP